MAILPIFLYGNDILRKKAKPVQQVTDELVQLIMDMYQTMHEAQGIGLAATQVGWLERVIVIDLNDVDEDIQDFKPLTLINPEVVAQDGVWVMEEGCLSIPAVRGEVERTERIILRYRDTNFNLHELEADGLLARVILHEIDHLDGVLFLDHLPKEKLAEHNEELERIKVGEVEVDYPVVSSKKVTV